MRLTLLVQHWGIDMNMVKVYTDGTKYSTRKFNGAWEETAEIEGEQFRRAAKRQGGSADCILEPCFWGVVNKNTNRIQRIVHSRAQARSIRKENERVIAGWV